MGRTVAETRDLIALGSMTREALEDLAAVAYDAELADIGELPAGLLGMWAIGRYVRIPAHRRRREHFGILRHVDHSENMAGERLVRIELAAASERHVGHAVAPDVLVTFLQAGGAS